MTGQLVCTLFAMQIHILSRKKIFCNKPFYLFIYFFLIFYEATKTPTEPDFALK